MARQRIDCRRPVWLGILVGAGVLVPGAYAGNVLYVDDDAPPGGDGSTWRTAFQYLTDAFSAAGPGSGIDEIRVAQGVYRPDRSSANPGGSGDRAAAFDLVSGVTVKGGYLGLQAGKGGDPDERDLARYPSILSGDLLGDDGPGNANNQENSLHVVRVLSTVSGAAIDGLVIVGGNANEGDGRGGGLHHHVGSVTALDCTFQGNTAIRGAGVSSYSGTASFKNCTFLNNVATFQGGGCQLESSAATLSGCLFAGNSAGLVGGALLTDEETPVLTECTFTGNTADRGGAIYCNNSLDELGPALVGCLFASNSAESDGGAVRIAASHPTFSGCTFNDNTADRGGAVFASGIGLSFTAGGVFSACMFTRNHALSIGGAVYNQPVNTPAFADCSFISNSALFAGGAMYNEETSPALTQCQFLGNQVDPGNGEGGAIGNFDGSSPAITACTFTGNQAGTGGAISTFLDCAPLLQGCTFAGNQAVTGGGVSALIGGPVHYVDCEFTGNAATDDGGAIWSRLSDSLLEGCTLETNEALNGGAVFSRDGDLTLVECTVRDNFVTLRGGGLHASESGNVHVSGCTFHGNDVEAQTGGAIYVNGPEIQVTFTVFEENGSGAVVVAGRGATCENCQFAGNEGGVHASCDVDLTGCLFVLNAGSSIVSIDDRCRGTLTACDFIANEVVGSVLSSGVVKDGNTSLRNCTFMDHVGNSVISTAMSSMFISECLFSGNMNGVYQKSNAPMTVEDCLFMDGGGVRNDSIAILRGCVFLNEGSAVRNVGGERLTLVDCTIEQAGTGVYMSGSGAVEIMNCRIAGCDYGLRHFSFDTSITLANCTLSGNERALFLQQDPRCRLANCTLAQNDMGIDVYLGGRPEVELSNCVVWESPLDGENGDWRVLYSDIQGGWTGEGYGNIDADPLFVSAGGGDFRLGPDSPCIDSGHNWGLPQDGSDLDGDGDQQELLPLDLGGLPRFAAGPAGAPAGGPGCGVPVIIDMGAHELEGVGANPVRLGDINGDGAVGIRDLADLIVVWGVCEGCCLGDLDLDGTVDVDDLVTLLVNWYAPGP